MEVSRKIIDLEYRTFLWCSLFCSRIWSHWF